MPKSSLPPYKGSKKALVLSIDVGTTYSGISYAILDPGEVPEIKPVLRYPGRENTPNDYRVPTIVCYRSSGAVYACGAEAEALEDDADNDFVDLEDDEPKIEDLTFVRRFKLHLRPESVSTSTAVKNDLPPLPAGKSVVQVFADFLKYMFACARKYIIESVANGRSLWSQVESQIVFVLAHPNGWEGLQQNKMRDAAALAGLMPDTSAGRDRIHFVTEGEASVHYCVQKGLIGDRENEVSSGDVMVIDAGGGTVDLSSYTFTSTAPLSAFEIAPPGCLLEGSTIVSKRAEQFLKERFKGTEYGKDREIRMMVKDFDTNLKTLFKASSTRPVRINHHLHSRDDPKLKLKRGYPVLTVEEMESFFRPALDGILAEVRTQFQKAECPITTAFLLGGFSSNDWLYERLKHALEEQFGLALSRPSSFKSKEVADGGVSYYIEGFVTHRVIKQTYGSDMMIPFLPFLPDHKARAGQVVLTARGPMIPRGFAATLVKGSRAKDNEEFSEPFEYILENSRPYNTLRDFSKEIMSYSGPENTIPQWLDVTPKRFKRVCIVRADLSKVAVERRDGDISPYYVKNFDVVFICGPELKAQIRWKENGLEKRGRAQIVYDE